MSGKELQQDLVLTLFVRRMEREGYHLRELRFDMLIWEGRQSIHRTIHRLLSRNVQARRSLHRPRETHDPS